MRRSEFTALAEAVFTPSLAAVYISTMHLPALGDRTPQQALDDGISVRRVWGALCDAHEVPEHRRWEIPAHLRERRSGH